MKPPFGRKTMAGAVVTLLLIGIGVAVATAAGIAGWEYTNSNAFCTNMCHAVHPEEPVAHADSPHARVNCVECHMGRLSTLELVGIERRDRHGNVLQVRLPALRGDDDFFQRQRAGLLIRCGRGLGRGLRKDETDRRAEHRKLVSRFHH